MATYDSDHSPCVVFMFTNCLRRKQFIVVDYPLLGMPVVNDKHAPSQQGFIFCRFKPGFRKFLLLPE